MKKTGRSSSSISRARDLEHLDLMLAAVWLYHEDHLTQSDVAEVLGVSRATVINLLQQALRDGVVKISVDSEQLSSLHLARALCDAHGLERCIVIPDDGGHRPVAQRVGEAGARLLSSVIIPGDVVGVAWGQTVLALSQAMERKVVEGVTVVQITGSTLSPYAFSPELCSANLADRLGARCINLHAPALLSRPEVRDLLCKEPAIKSQLALLKTCTKVVFGVGEVDRGATVFESGFVSYKEARPYLIKGATGVISARFIDAKGKIVHDFLDDRMIGMDLKDMARVPVRICVAGGLRKVAAIRAALAGKHATMLVTDAATAKALLDEPA